MARRLLTRGAALVAALLPALWGPDALASAPPLTSGVPITDNAVDDVGAHAAADAAGNVHVVWERAGSVYYRVKTASGLGPEEFVGAGGAPAVALGSRGMLFVAYVSAGQAIVSKRYSDGWTWPEVVVFGGVANVDLAIAFDDLAYLAVGGDLDGNGRPDVALYRGRGGMWDNLASYGGWFDGWPCYCGEYFYTPDVAVDAAGFYYFAFRDGHPGSGSGNWSSLRVVTDNPAWTSADLSGPGFGINAHAFRKGSLAVDGAGVVHLVEAASGRCWAATVDGNSFSETDLGAGSQPALTVDAAGAVHVAFQDGAGAISYARDDGTGFSPWAIASGGAWPTVADDGNVFFEAGSDLEIDHLLPGGALAASPSSLGFGVTPAGGSATADLVLENGGGAKPVLLGGLSISGPQASSFAIASDGCSGKSLAGGASCTVSVGFSPDAAGDFAASLAVPSSNPYGPEAILLQGRGISCSYDLASASATLGASPGEGTVDVSASDPACPWTAAANDAFLAISSGASGTGSGTVSWTAAENAGPARSGALTIAGRTFTVDQADGCRISFGQRGEAAAAGASVGVAVSASDPACAWAASSNASWIAIASGASGSGDGEVVLAVAPNAGPARSGAVTIGAETYTLAQADGCAFSIAPSSASVTSGVEGGTVTVTASDAACAWTASSGTSWLSVDSGASGTGDGVVSFATQPNLGPDRSGTLTVAGETFTVSQAGGCTYALSATGDGSFGAQGKSASFDVTASDAACTFEATTSDAWITIDSGASGTGGGTVSYTVSPNVGLTRGGTITAAGQTFYVGQAGGCTFSISPASATAAHGGASGTVAVTASDGACPWTAVSSDGWLTVDAGAAGTGSGTVSYTAAQNAGAARTGTIAIAGQPFTLDQAAPAAPPPSGGGGGCSTAPFGPEALLLGLLGLLRTRRKA